MIRSNKIKIIRAKKPDIIEIAKLMKKELAKPPFNERDNLENIVKSLNFYFKIGDIYIIKENNELIAVLVFKKEQYWEGQVIVIEDLVIKNEFQGKSIGSRLMNHLEAYARKNKINSILFTTNKKSKAVIFYKKLGYKIEKNRICMRKNLK